MKVPASTNNVLFIQLKNYSKTFNALISTPYSYPKQTTTAPRVIILTKYTVVCNMPFNVYLFYFPDFLNLLGENN